MLAIKGCDLVAWAALAEAVSRATASEDRALRAQFGVLPRAVAAIRTGLAYQGIALDGTAPPGPWIAGDAPQALEHLHRRAVRWFGSSHPGSQAYRVGWVRRFPGIISPGAGSHPRLHANLLDWLASAAAPRQGPLKVLRDHLATPREACLAHTTLALAHVRAVALGCLSTTPKG